MTQPMAVDVCVIGGGPAGLMAAEVAVQAGCSVLIADRMPTFGRKFLMAGKSGLNLTKSEPLDRFAARIAGSPAIRAAVEDFGPDEVQAWARGLGQEVFVGSSGRVFPHAMKASPLLRAWLARLAGGGVEFRTRWRWAGWDRGVLRFETPDGARSVDAGATVLAVGGASWPQLGSDGAWATALPAAVGLRGFASSNAGLRIDWSDAMARHAGTPLKPVALTLGDCASRGECVISAGGLEGSAVYDLSPAMRRAGPGVTLWVDLAPGRDRAALAARLARPRGRQSMANHLRRAVSLTGAKAALLREGGTLPDGPDALAARIKAVPLQPAGLQPLDRAISSVGGVPMTACDGALMLHAMPGVFCAGEMLDWDAPTGGYLITACLATGRVAGHAAAHYALRARTAR